jgi:hypothetical protein
MNCGLCYRLAIQRRGEYARIAFNDDEIFRHYPELDR